jgi:hypothetical protein
MDIKVRLKPDNTVGNLLSGLGRENNGLSEQKNDARDFPRSTIERDRNTEEDADGILG